MKKLKINNKNSKTKGKTGRSGNVKNYKNTDEGIENLLKFGFIVLVGLILIFNETSLVSAHLDTGNYIVTEEVVIDTITLIACDEVKPDFSGEDVRVYTKFVTRGHRNQEAMLAYPDDKYTGVYKDDYIIKGKKGDTIVVGETVFFHVDCNPPEKFNFEIRIWDDDSWNDMDDIVEDIAKALGVTKIAISKKIGVNVWGLGLGKVIEKIMAESKDNEQSVTEIGFDSSHTGAKQFTVQTTLDKGGDLDWKKGDPGSDVNFTITIKEYTDRACNHDGYTKTVKEFLKQLELEIEIEEKLQKDFQVMHDASKRGDLDQTKALVNTFEKYVKSLISSGEISLRDGNILVVYAQGYIDFMHPYVRLDPVAVVNAGTPLVVKGASNRQEGFIIVVTCKGPVELQPEVVKIENDAFTATFDTTDALTGEYVVKADDGDGHTDELEVFITGKEMLKAEAAVEKVVEEVEKVVEEILATPKPTPKPTPEPTPKPPGFEALFAIVGLLAVAYLLRRNG
jgi:PGF-CTERM protein